MTPRREQRHARDRLVDHRRLQRRHGRLRSPACRARGRSPRSPATTLNLTGARDRPGRRATLTVFGYDPALAGPVRMGGDDLHVGTYVTDADERRRRPRSRARTARRWVDRRLRGRPAGRHPRRRRRLDGHRRQRLDAHAHRRRRSRRDRRADDGHDRPDRRPRRPELAARPLRRHVTGRPLVQRQPGDGRRPRVRRQAVQPVHLRARRRERGRRVGLPARQPVPLLGQRRDRRERALRRTSSATRPARTCRSVGITAYGGAGNDTIIGSQTGDFLAGGSGDDRSSACAATTRSTATPASTSTSSRAA